jgi:hypothetical protein
MNSAIATLFEEYSTKNNGLADRAIAELIQSIALLALSRTDFFSKAAFYGGTALRIVHGLERFSDISQGRFCIRRGIKMQQKT